MENEVDNGKGKEIKREKRDEWRVGEKLRR